MVLCLCVCVFILDNRRRVIRADGEPAAATHTDAHCTYYYYYNIRHALWYRCTYT